MKARKICVVTGTRAEYGLLSPLIRQIQEDSDLELQLIATASHLSYEHGLTYQAIEEDGFVIDEKVEMLMSSDTSTGIAKSMGVGMISFADVFNRLNPDIIVILGDRYELLSIASVALVQKIPIAHIHGGETTLGAYDDSIRHAVTKMSTLHFPSTQHHKERIVQMGENPDNVFIVGALGVDNIKNSNLMSKEELSRELGIEWDKQIFMITFHPETMKENPASSIYELLSALEDFENTTLVFTKANSDEDGRKINEAILRFVNEKPEERFLFDSLGHLKYLSMLKQSNMVIGNSSSALLEAPYLKTVSVNIGDRQKGRQRPSSVFDTIAKSENIKNSILKALKFDFNKEDVEIFGDGTAALKIKKILKNTSFEINQPFYEIKELDDN